MGLPRRALPGLSPRGVRRGAPCRVARGRGRRAEHVAVRCSPVSGVSCRALVRRAERARRAWPDRLNAPCHAGRASSYAAARPSRPAMPRNAAHCPVVPRHAGQDAPCSARWTCCTSVHHARHTCLCDKNSGEHELSNRRPVSVVRCPSCPSRPVLSGYRTYCTG